MHTRSVAITIAGVASLLLPTALLSQTRMPPAPQSFALTHVTVVDVVRGRPLAEMTVVVADRRIASIGPTTSVRIPSGAQTIDATGKFLIPGLWDMHLHSFTDFDTNWMYPLLLAHGVTGVRELGTRVAPERIAQIRREILEGTRLGPRYGSATGTILDGPGSTIRPSVVVETPEQGRQRVKELRAHGLDFVKVYNLLSREVYLAIVDEAKRQNLPVVGHVPFSSSAAEASDLGQISLEHFTDILVSTSRDEVRLREERRSLLAAGGPVGPAGPVETKAAATFDAAKARALFERLSKNRTWVCPTLNLSGTLPIERRREGDERLKYVPAPTQEFWKSGLGRGVMPNAADSQTRRARRLEAVGLMQRSGVRLLAGSDAPNPFVYPGFSLHEELQLLVEAGLTRMEALQTATINPARFLGREKDLGSVDRGKFADLVLLSADPLADIGNTGKIDAVVVNGRLLDRKALDALLAGVEAANKGTAR